MYLMVIISEDCKGAEHVTLSALPETITRQ